MTQGIDVVLILTICVMGIIAGMVVAMMIIKYGHPDDQNQAKLPKAITFLGLWLALVSILIVPYDVANTKGGGKGLEMDILWMMLYGALVVMIFAVIPFGFFFYESDMDPEEEKKAGFCGTQFGQALCYSSIFFVVFSLICAISYVFLSEVSIPVETYQLPDSQIFSDPDIARQACSNRDACGATFGHTTWKIQAGFGVYGMAMMAFVGWWFFSIFAGVGLIALPMDLIQEFRSRPERISTKEYLERKKELGIQTQNLQELGDKFLVSVEAKTNAEKGFMEKRSEKKMYNKFTQNYYLLKKDIKLLEMAHKLQNTNPVWDFFKLVCGICGSLISLSWLLHIGLFMVTDPPVHPFLNSFIINMEELFGSGRNAFPLLGVLCFTLWSLYLLACVVKGNFKLGVRFLVWKMYPMEINNTLMNAFLWNTWFILLCSIPCVQFCTVAFSVYARETDLEFMVGQQIKYLSFFSFFYDNLIFVFMTLGFAFLSLVYLCIFPTDRAAEVQKSLEKMAL